MALPCPTRFFGKFMRHIARTLLAALLLSVSVVPAIATEQKMAKVQKAQKVQLVDINSASKAQLATLPGITSAYAAQIVASRPYGSKSHLTTRGILPRDVYERLKDKIVARQDPASLEKLLKK